MADNIRDQGILHEIGVLASSGKTGRLGITMGMTQGAIFFKDGQLVDAHLGDLNGFRAINAVASVPEVSFTFNPSIAPPVHSSITPNERILLKDFFGIETVEGDVSYSPEDGSWPSDDYPAQKVVPLIDAASAATESTPYAQPTQAEAPLLDDQESLSRIAPEAKPESTAALDESLTASDTKESAFHADVEKVVSDKDDEATLLKTKIPRDKDPRPLLYHPTSNFPHRTGFIVAAVVILIAAVAVVSYKLRGRNSSAPAVATVETVAPVDTQPTASVTPATADLSGNWTVVNTVEQTSYQAFKNLQIGFSLSIDQNGTDFTGKGEKVSENGRSLPAAGRTPITVKGSIDGDRVEATFFEDGRVRKSQGRFAWRIDKTGGGLSGTFVSTAAGASGTSAATKQL